eukprot:gene20658-20194_t
MSMWCSRSKSDLRETASRSLRISSEAFLDAGRARVREVQAARQVVDARVLQRHGESLRLAAEAATAREAAAAAAATAAERARVARLNVAGAAREQEQKRRLREQLSAQRDVVRKEAGELRGFNDAMLQRQAQMRDAITARR